MRPKPETIRLGDKEFLLRPLTLRQVQEIEPVLTESQTSAKGNIATSMAIVTIALLRDHADAAATLGDIEATAGEIGAAMTVVLRLGGFIPGEAEAAGIQAPSGEVSTAA